MTPPAASEFFVARLTAEPPPPPLCTYWDVPHPYVFSPSIPSRTTASLWWPHGIYSASTPAQPTAFTVCIQCRATRQWASTIGMARSPCLPAWTIGMAVCHAGLPLPPRRTRPPPLTGPQPRRRPATSVKAPPLEPQAAFQKCDKKGGHLLYLVVHPSPPAASRVVCCTPPPSLRERRRP